MLENGRLGPEIIETTDEDGQIHVFEKIDEFDFEDQRYALLIYQGGEEGDKAGGCGDAACDEDHGYDEEVVVMRVTRADDGDTFEAIEDEEEFERILQFIEAMDDEEDEDEEEDAE